VRRFGGSGDNMCDTVPRVLELVLFGTLIDYNAVIYSNQVLSEQWSWRRRRQCIIGALRTVCPLS